MWLGVWMALSVAGVRSQTAHTKLEQSGGGYEWGWQLTPREGGTVGHYFVRLPQSEQQVRYVADENGLRDAAAVTGPHEASQIPTQLFQVLPSNETKEPNVSPGSQSPLEIYLLPHQLSPQTFGDQFIQIPQQNIQFSTPNLYFNNNVATSVQYSVQTLHPIQLNEQINDHSNAETNEGAESSNPLQNKDDNAEQDHAHLTTNVVQVFKDHNCTSDDDTNRTPKEYSNNHDRPAYAETSSYDIRNINGNFGIKEGTERSLYRGAVNFRVEPPQNIARSERYYYNQAPTTVSTLRTEDERISRLVASTQDIISNEDLLKINHAVEKLSNVHNDDIIKPKPRSKHAKTRHDNAPRANTPRSRITVKAKIANIVDSEIEHLENNRQKEEVLQTNSNQYTFASPIVVQDPNYDNFKEQIVNNLVSTMVPYLQDGYEIVGVRNGVDENYTNSDYNKQTSGEDLVNVTPRPISQKYLAPITVALRLFNANNTEDFNTIDDHDVSDSEVVTDTVKSPEHERTVVEIQKSIPLDITHINDVEVHQYLEEGRSNDKGPLDLAKSLYHTYMNALRSSDTSDRNYGKGNSNKNQQNDSKEQLDESENIQTEVEIRPNDDASHERREYARPYYNSYNYNEDQKVIQPIIIEKEVPVTQFVDRFIEKEVPYPERVEVIKHVPVDRPVAVPVPYEKIVDRPVEVTRFVDKPYPVEVPHLYPVQVPYPVEQKVYVDRPVHVPYPVDRVVEKQVYHHVPVPTPVAVPVEVPVEKQVLYPVPIETPVPYRVEVEKPVPVEKIVHKEVPVPYAVEKRVPFPVHYETKVPVPYPVEKRIPVPVDRIVEKKVPVPYPVERVIEKIVEKPVVVTKYVDKPYPVEKRVPYPVEKIVEKKVPYRVEVPVEVKVPYPVEKNVDRPVYVPIRVPYHYNPRGYNSPTQQSQNFAQYQRYTPEQHKRGVPAHLNINEVQYIDQKPQITQHNQYVQNVERQKTQPIQTTHWGNLYASSYQYINSTPKYETKEFRKTPGLVNYIHYLTNNHNHRNEEYYGPPPVAQHDNVWEENKKYLVELKLRRADRTPKSSNLRIEYGFKPPLIPSTEIDLDGLPVKKD